MAWACALLGEPFFCAMGRGWLHCKQLLATVAAQASWVAPARVCVGTHAELSTGLLPVLQLDMSLWAFEKLADTKWGVMSIEWRDVPCWYRPVKRAKNPYGKISSGERPAPKNWQAAYDKRPFNTYGFYADYVPAKAAAVVTQESAPIGRKLRGVSV